MKYRLTPGNLGGCLLIGTALTMIFLENDPYEAWGGGIILFACIRILLGDLFLQVFITDHKKLVIIESIILLGLLIGTLAA